MSLISTARALDDSRFLWRVRAGMLKVATSKYVSTSSTADDKALAQEILDNPMSSNSTMEALVATNATVSNSVFINDQNTVDTESVTDEMILDAITQYWSPVAKRRAEKAATTVR